MSEKAEENFLRPTFPSAAPGPLRGFPRDFHLRAYPGGLQDDAVARVHQRYLLRVSILERISPDLSFNS